LLCAKKARNRQIVALWAFENAHQFLEACKFFQIFIWRFRGISAGCERKNLEIAFSGKAELSSTRRIANLVKQNLTESAFRQCFVVAILGERSSVRLSRVAPAIAHGGNGRSPGRHRSQFRRIRGTRQDFASSLNPPAPFSARNEPLLA
jgi:hypothetical protein